MQYKYKKTIVLFTMMIAIYFAIIFVISNIKENDFDSTMQNDAVTSTIETEEIYTPEEYIAFAKSVNSGNTYQNCEVSLHANLVILPAIFEPPVRTFGATIPVFESQLFQ